MAIHFGFHASAKDGLAKIPLTVKQLGGECFQFFSRNPAGGKATPIDKTVAEKFKAECKKNKINNSYVHAAYFINLASQNNRIFYGSIKAIQEDIERAEILGARYVVTHIGSAKDFTIIESPSFDQNISTLPEKYPPPLLKTAFDKNFTPRAFARVLEGLEKIVAGRKKIPLLLEIAAGAGAILGSNIEELPYYLKSVPAISGFCFDTAHAYASGYDITTPEGLRDVFYKIENEIGKEKIKLIHLNDSMGSLGSKVDRHAHIGNGHLGEKTFQNLVDYLAKKNYNIDIILETPTLEGLKRDLKILKSYRKNCLNRKFF